MEVRLVLEPAAALFYRQLGDILGLPWEQVMADALFKLAGELSLQAIRNKTEKPL